MFGAGAVRSGKARKLARISVTLGVVLLFCAIGMTITAAAPNDIPPGQEQCDDGHGANDKPCKPDNENGQDCEAHGNGGVNEDHCLGEEPTTGGTTGSTSGTSTGDSSGTTTGDTSGTTTGDTSGTTTGDTSGTTTGDTSGTTTGDTSGTTTGDTSGTTTGDTSGSSTGDTSTGAENGTTTGTPVVESDNEVLGRVIDRKQLATTGNETTVLAIFGFALLMLGSALRFGRFGTQVAVATAADELVSRSLMLIERQTRTGSRYWNHRF